MIRKITPKYNNTQIFVIDSINKNRYNLDNNENNK